MSPKAPLAEKQSSITAVWLLGTASFSFALASGVSAANSSADPGTTTSIGATPSQAASQLLTEELGPFKLTFGQQDSGGFGANLNGQGRKDFLGLNSGPLPEDVSRFWYFPFAYLSYSATGSWASSQSTTNNASLSLQPGLDALLEYGKFHESRPKLPVTGTPETGYRDADGNPVLPSVYPAPYLGFGGAGDLELRYGTFQQNGTNVTARELLVGAQLYAMAIRRNWDFGPSSVLASPRLTVTYYHSTTATGSTEIALPANIKADYLQTELETVLGFGGSGRNVVKLDVKFDGSKPMTGDSRGWQHLWTLKFWVPGLKFNGVSPSVSYQSGENGGFKYDRQILLGALFEFLDPKGT